jgi:hypothetical protein
MDGNRVIDEMQRSADRQTKVLNRCERDKNELATQKAQVDIRHSIPPYTSSTQ